MTPKQFKPIILRTLREGKKFQTVDAFADYLVGKMEDFEDMFSMALEVAGTQPQIQFTPFPESVSRQEAPQPAAPSDAVLPTGDVSDRFKPKTTQVGFVENFTKEELYTYYSAKLPSTITVNPKNCLTPIALNRFIHRGPGDSFADMKSGGVYLPIVKITYSQPGVSDPAECVMVTVSTTDTDMSAERVLKQIVEMANARYTSERRKVEPKQTIPPPASLDDTIRGTQEDRSPWNTTDENVSQNDMAQWGSPVAGVAASRFKG